MQEPFVNIPEDTVREALKVVLGNGAVYFCSFISFWLSSAHLIFMLSLQMLGIIQFWFIANEERYALV